MGIANPDRAVPVLHAQGWQVTRDGAYLVVSGSVPPAHITQALAAHGLYLDELVPVRADLESVFLELTAGRGPGTQAPEEVAP